MSGKGDIPNPEAWIKGPFLAGTPDPVLSQINLTWVLNNTYPGASSLSLYRSDNGGGFVAIATNIPFSQTSYLDTNLGTGHTYIYYLSVQYANGGPVNSNQVAINGTIIDMFLASGTWTKRAGVKSIRVTAIGPGGGGQGGFARAAPSTFITGCGGGSGGGFAAATIQAANLPATAPVVVGLGGLGGAGQTEIYPTTSPLTPIDAANGSGPSSFNGTWVVGNSGLGSAGTASVNGGTGTVAAPSPTSVVTETGGTGGSPLNAASNDTQRNGGSTTLGAGGGGAGGGCTAVPTANAGVVPGLVQNGGASPSAIGGVGGAGAGNQSGTTNATGTPGTAGANGTNSGGGGGGGGGCAFTGSSTPNLVATGAAGADGGQYGAGGGGGGAGECIGGGNFLACTAISGKGGNGKQGIVIVQNFFW